MKILKAFQPVLAAGIIFSCIAVSCGNSKKAAVPCPDFSKSRSYRSDNKGTWKNPSVQFVQRSAVKRSHQTYTHAELASIDHPGVIPNPDVLQPLPGQNRTSGEFVPAYSKSGEIQRITDAAGIFPVSFSIAPASVDSRHTNDSQRTLVTRDSITVCDTVVFKAGNMLLAKVVEIGLNEIKYRECENLSGPLISILKSDVFVIKYPNGTRDYFDQMAPVIKSETTNTAVAQPEQPKIAGIGIAGFVASLLGLLVAGLPLGIFAIIAGSLGLGRIERNPGKYKGKGFATASLIIGMIDVVGVLLYLMSI